MNMQMSNRFFLTLFTTLAMMACAPALMAMEKQTLPFWEIVSCDSEDIEIEGTVRFQEHLVEGENHTTYVVQAFWKGMGLGLDSGAKYRLRGKWMTLEQEDPPYIMIWNDHFQLIGKGAAPNYRFYAKLKFIVNAKGETIIDLYDEEWPCETIDGSVG
jgi:hypothetical protein